MQKVLYTAQNVRRRVRCAESALYSTKCTMESEMCKSALYSTKCTMEREISKKCSIQHKMYVGERDEQKVLYTAQNVRWRER